MKVMSNNKNENIWNIPNTLTFLRLVITFATIYCIFAQFSWTLVAVLFAIGMITDFLDGQIARRWNTETEFGRKFDMIADRFLMIGVALALVFELSLTGEFGRYHLLQVFLIMIRELLTFPFAIIAFAAKKRIPDARFVGKLTTCLQGFTLPAILLSIYYPIFSFSIGLAIITCIVGVISAFYYVNDLKKQGKLR